MNGFSDNLKRLRKARNMKQEDLAERLNVTRQTVSGWETGRRQPDLDTLQVLAEVLGADIHELIYGIKPGAYPRFQKKYVVRAGLSGAVLLAYLIFRIFLQRWVVALCSSYYFGYALGIIHFVLPVVGLFCAGFLLPSAVALYTAVEPGITGRKRCVWIGAVLALFPVLSVICTVLRFVPSFLSWIFLYESAKVLILYTAPFLSGLLLGFCTESGDEA